MVDDLGSPIKVGDVLYNEYDYYVTVQQDSDGGFSGKLVCDPAHSCARIPYALNGGKGHVVRRNNKEEKR